MGIDVRLIYKLPVGESGYVSRIALCDQEDGDGVSVRPMHIVHADPGGDAEVPIKRTEQGYTVWLPAGFEAKGHPHDGEELVATSQGTVEELWPEAARYWRENGLLPKA